MQKKLVLSVTLAILFVCGTPLQMQAGVTKVIKKTTGVFLGAVALGTMLDLCLGTESDGVVMKGLDIIGDDCGKAAYWICIIPFIPSSVLGYDRENSLIKSKNYSIAVRLALFAATIYGSYKLLKPSADLPEENEQEYDKDEQEYRY